MISAANIRQTAVTGKGTKHIMATKIKAEEPVIYTVRIAGEATVTTGRGKEIVNYDVTVLMDEQMVSMNPMSAWRNHIAPLVMPKVFRGFVKCRESHVVEAERSDGEGISNIYLMSRQDLVEFIKLSKYPINTHLYKDAGQLRQAILLYKENPIAHKSFEKKERKRAGATFDIQDRAERLNANIVINHNDETGESPEPKGSKIKPVAFIEPSAPMSDPRVKPINPLPVPSNKKKKQDDIPAPQYDDEDDDELDDLEPEDEIDEEAEERRAEELAKLEKAAMLNSKVMVNSKSEPRLKTEDEAEGKAKKKSPAEKL